MKKDERPFNPYTFDPYEPHPRDLESAIVGCLGYILGFGLAIIICSVIYIFSV